MSRVGDMAISFVKDIKLMMFGLGDSKRPFQESAVLMELILIEEIHNILYQATEIMEIRGGSTLGPEDIIFLMKNNEVALKRLLTYLSLKDEKAVYDMQLGNYENENVELETDPETGLDDEELSTIYDEPRKLPCWKKNRKEYCIQFLSYFGFEESDLMKVSDLVKEERDSRASNISLNLTPTAYQEYHAARCKSFAGANMDMDKFERWLKVRVNYTDVIDKPVVELLVYLAKETIACLMDMIMCIRDEHDMETPTVRAITINEIREAVRRHTFLQTQPNALLSRDINPVIHRRLISF